jgi:transcriptional regulator with XRE-family HTH domain
MTKKAEKVEFVGPACAVGRWIEKKRKLTGMTQTALAELCGYERGSLWQVIHGVKAPGLPLIAELAKALGENAGELLDVALADWRVTQHDRLTQFQAVMLKVRH